jgi:hypothetical protein
VKRCLLYPALYRVVTDESGALGAGGERVSFGPPVESSDVIHGFERIAAQGVVD